MSITYVDIIYILVSILSFVWYKVFLKKFSNQTGLVMIGLFWINFLAYIFYVLIYLARKFILEHDIMAVEELLHEFTFYNAPLYLITGLSFVGSTIIYARLIQKYEISRVIPFANLSLILTEIGYIILGDQFNSTEFLGITVISLGSLITGLNSLSVTHFIRNLKKIPKDFLWGIAAESILKSITAICTFFLTQRTQVSERVMSSLRHIFPFEFHNPFYTNLGVRFFIMLSFFFYIHRHTEYTGKIIPTLHKYWYVLLILSILFLISAYAHNIAYALTPDKTIIAALSKLNAPFILCFAYMILKEKITIPKAIGTALITIGGLIIFIGD